MRAILAPEALDDLIVALRRRGFRVLGPTVRDGAIVYDELDGAAELPVGWTDKQEPGSYRLERRDDEARFGYAVGPHSWKRFLFPSRVTLWRARAENGGRTIEEEPPDDTPLAFIGVRSCELSAISIQDRVFLGGKFVDRDYAARREGAFLVAVNCGEPGANCFCASMDAGPRVRDPYDLALTEVLDGEHRFLVEAGSERGAEVLAELTSRPASEDDLAAATAVTDDAAARMTKAMPQVDLHALLAGSLEHPRWDDVAARCLTCGNCTLVCPTCFCSSVEDTSDLTGVETARGARLGLVLLARLLVHPRRQHPRLVPLPLPAVAHAQARHLGRPVRYVRLRRLRPLHHVVPGRDRHHRRGRRAERTGGEQCPSSLTRSCRTSRSSPGCRRRRSR